MARFFAMGGYAAYVWPAFGVVAAVLLGMLALSLRRMRAAEAALAEIEARTGGARRKRQGGDEA